MPPVEHHPAAMAKANGIELCHDSFGSLAAPPIVLIMGLGAQMVMWDEGFCRMLAEQGFRVIRFDNRDIGKSTRLTGGPVPGMMQLIQAHLAGKPIAAPYLLGDMADDTAGLLDALGLPTAHIVGASMGGAIAQEMAMRHPARVKSLTTIMASTGRPGLPPPTPEAAAVLMTPAPATKEDYIAAFQRNWKVLRAGSFPDDEVLDRTRAETNFSRGLHPEGVARQLVAIFASGSRVSRLGSVKAPTLVIHGKADPLVPHDHGLDIAASIPGARMMSIDGMGHAISIPFWKGIAEAIAAHARAAN